MAKTRVVFVCTQNAARSQMAEAFLRRLAPDRCEASSAGIAPTELDPLAVRAMAEVGIDISGQQAKSLQSLLAADRFDFLVTLCDDAATDCATSPADMMRLHWPVADPAAVDGDEDDRLEAYRAARDEIHARIRAWLGVALAA